MMMMMMALLMTMLMMLMVQAPRLTGERPRNLRGCGSCCGGPFVALGFAEPTPRDEAHRGPIEPQELLPRDPPPPEPVCAHALSLSFGMQWGTMLWARTLTRSQHAAGADSFERTPSRPSQSASDHRDDDSIEDASSTVSSNWKTTELVRSRPKPALAWPDRA